MATTNATADDVRVALKPFSTDLEDEDIIYKISEATHIVSGRTGRSYTVENEPLSVRLAVVRYCVYLVINTVFFDETLTTVSWRFKDIEIDHAQNAFAIRDFAMENLNLANTMLGTIGISILSANSYKEWETKKAGRPDGHYYDEDGVVTG